MLRLARRPALLLPLLLSLSCSYGNFWIPADDIRDEFMPPEYITQSSTGWTWLKIAPEHRGESGYYYSDFRNFELLSYSSGRTGDGVIAVRPGYLWVVPKPRYKLTGAEYLGLVQFERGRTVGTRLMPFNVGLPSAEVNAVDLDGRGMVWIATEDGAARYDPMPMRVDVFDDWNTFEQEGGGLQNTFLGISWTPAVHDIAHARGSVFFVAGKLFQYNIESHKWSTTTPDYTTVDLPGREHSIRVKRRIEVELEDQDGNKRKKVYPYTVTVVMRTNPQKIIPSPKGYLDGSIDRVEAVGEDLWVLSRHGVSRRDGQTGAWESWAANHEDWTASETCEKYRKVGPKGKPRKVCVREVHRFGGHLYGTDDDLPGITATAVHPVGDEVWVAFSPAGEMGAEKWPGGLRAWSQPKGWRRIAEPLEGMKITDIDTVGRPYLAYERALLAWNGSGFEVVDFTAGFELEEEPVIIDLARQNDELWVATTQGIFFKKMGSAKPGGSLGAN